MLSMALNIKYKQPYLSWTKSNFICISSLYWNTLLLYLCKTTATFAWQPVYLQQVRFLEVKMASVAALSIKSQSINNSVLCVKMNYRIVRSIWDIKLIWLLIRMHINQVKILAATFWINKNLFSYWDILKVRP